jgi:hypothetical protein
VRSSRRTATRDDLITELERQQREIEQRGRERQERDELRRKIDRLEDALDVAWAHSIGKRPRFRVARRDADHDDLGVVAISSARAALRASRSGWPQGRQWSCTILAVEKQEVNPQTCS